MKDHRIPDSLQELADAAEPVDAVKRLWHKAAPLPESVKPAE